MCNNDRLVLLIKFNMEVFLKRRREDPRFTNERRVTGVHSSNASWYNEAPRTQAQDGGGGGSGLVRSRHRFAEEKKKKASSDKEASSSSSESDGEGGRKKKSKGNAPGYDGPDKCWDGYEKVPGKMRGEKGSCKKA